MFVVGGESLIDLVSEPRGADGVIHMHAHQGGSPMNCAIALSKLGNPTGFLCPISKDGFGDYILEPLEAAGVRPLLGERVVAPTTLAVVTLNQKKQARYEFYRYADHPLEAPQMIAALPEKVSLYQTGGFCPIEPRDAAIWLEVIDEAARRGATISIDANVRPSLIADFEGYRQRLDAFLDRAHLIKMSDEDLLTLRPDLSLEAHAAELLARPKAELVVVTLGEHGSFAWSKTGRATAPIWSPPVFGDTVGAGDSLMAGVLSILSEKGDLVPGRLAQLGDAALGEMLRFGAVVAGLNCGHKGCVPPTRPEVDAVLAQF
jgi:fructokinase